MAVDSSTLLNVIMDGQELLDGLRNSMPNFDDRVCDVRMTDSLSGTIPYLAFKDSAGVDGGAQAVGADPDETNFELSSLAYEMEQYGRKIYVPKAIVTDLNQYMASLREMAVKLMEENAIARERDLAALLTDSTYNEQQAATNGNWSVPTSKPVVDMLTLKKEKVPVIDTVIIGSQSALELKTHPDITAMAGLAYASAGAVTNDMLQGIVGQILGVAPDRVLIWDTFYNSANYGQTAVLARVTGDFFWAGTQASVKKIAQNGMRSALSLIEGHTSFSQAVVDVCDFVATPAGSFRGGEITGL